MKKILSRATALFPVWALLASAWAYFQPGPWSAMKALIVPLLGVVMFGMGLTLKGDDFRRVLKRPGIVGLGLRGLVEPPRQGSPSRKKTLKISNQRPISSVQDKKKRNQRVPPLNIRFFNYSPFFTTEKPSIPDRNSR